jgi:hypothetical protein
MASLASCAYLIWGIHLLKAFANLVNPDGISYAEIARLYASGSYNEALNAYWGPLVSWLAVPFIHAGATPLQAIKLVLLLSGVLVFFASGWMMQRLKATWWLQLIAQAALIPVVASMALGVVTPDVLVTGLLLCYIALIMAKVDGRLGWSILVGILAVVGFFAKSIVLPVFLIHFTGYHIWLVYSRRLNRRKALLSLSAGLATFFICLAPWMVALSLKYHHPTLNTSSSYNLALSGPHSTGHPMLTEGLVNPPGDALSAWTDPSYIHIKPWNPLLEGRVYLVSKIWGNVGYALMFMGAFSVVALILAILGALIKLPGAADRRYLGLSAALIILAYSPLVMEPRYIWAAMILTALIAIGLLTTLRAQRLLSTTAMVVLSIALAISLYRPPLGGLTSAPSAQTDDIISAAESLRDTYHVSGRIASNDEWAASLYLSYFAGNIQYFGVIKSGQSGNASAAELAQNNIQYVLVWRGNDPSYLSNYHLLGPVEHFPNAVIYAKNGV